MSPGRHISTAMVARASAFMICDSRSRSTLRRRSSPIAVARRTDGCPPTTSANPTRTTPATTAVSRRGTPTMDSVKKTDEASRATLKPETAST
jgi:hypothetical protein